MKKLGKIFAVSAIVLAIGASSASVFAASIYKTPAEAVAAAAIEPGKPKKSGPGKVIRFGRGKVTKEDLLAGAACLDSLP